MVNFPFTKTTEKKTEKPNRRQFRRLLDNGFDVTLLILLLVTLVYGLIMVYSASTTVALRDWSDESHYFSRQLVSDLLGLALMSVVIFIPLKLYHWKFLPILEFLLAAAVVLLVIPFGVESHGARRWVQISFLRTTFQPAEVSKLMAILAMAAFLVYLGTNVNRWRGWIYAMLFPLPISLMIYFVTNNLSSALIVLAICWIMLFIACGKYKRYALLLTILVLIGAIIVIYTANLEPGSSSGFRIDRIYAWLHPDAVDNETAEQAMNSMYAIGRGGVLGSGLGNSIQKNSRLPEPQNDMIFAIICEELGIVGGLAVIGLFAMILWRIFVIAREANRQTVKGGNPEARYGFFITVGVFAHIAVQVVMNIAVATNSMPNTGVSLPFISYGGTSVLFLLIEMGLVFAVNRQNRKGAMS